MSDYISRDQVLSLLYRYCDSLMDGDTTLIEKIEALPCFPAPNPEQRDGRNIMGQTEEEFWLGVEEA